MTYVYLIKIESGFKYDNLFICESFDSVLKELSEYVWNKFNYVASAEFISTKELIKLSDNIWEFSKFNIEIEKIEVKK